MENPSTHVAATIREKCRFTVRSTVSTIKCYTGANIKYPNSVIIFGVIGRAQAEPETEKGNRI